MSFVPVPKDLTKVKTKVAFNLTKRQLICFGLAALVGIPTYFLSRSTIGNSLGVLLMLGIMLPFFFIAMYEKDGQPAEKILRNIIHNRISPKRYYKTENFYQTLSTKEVDVIAESALVHRKKKAPTKGDKAIRKKPR